MIRGLGDNGWDACHISIRFATPILDDQLIALKVELFYSDPGSNQKQQFKPHPVLDATVVRVMVGLGDMAGFPFTASRLINHQSSSSMTSLVSWILWIHDALLLRDANEPPSL